MILFFETIWQTVMDIDFPLKHSIRALNIKIELNASNVFNDPTKLFLLKFVPMVYSEKRTSSIW